MRKNMHVSLDLSSVNVYITSFTQMVYKIVVQLWHACNRALGTSFME
jgi:hypothetical protein